MTLAIARAALYAVIPAELLFAVLLLSGVAPPAPLIAVAEAAVAAALVLEAVVAGRLFRAARRRGMGRRAALRAVYEHMVPDKVRRVAAFDGNGLLSLVLWVARRRHGVPPGAVAVSYARQLTPVLTALLTVMIVETVGAELLLRAIGAPVWLRVTILVLDLYGVQFGLAHAAACVTRPHVVSAGELRVRHGVFFDLRVPRELITSVRVSPNYNESGMVRVKDGTLAVEVSSQTNVVVELSAPVTVVRPLGRRAEVTAIRLFADDPSAAVRALRPARTLDPS
ncbi:hypothetical protein [Sphaerisporangium dianthi]|uniref:Integral membrane protein n=1 Tax=Sphaerisporangium dianthi TaxID=1436120 RepID=A0ABV9CPS8_9ACTN